MDYETVGAADFGRELKGLGLNVLTRDVKGLASFLTDVFDMTAHRVTEDFAIMTYGGQVFQIHGDHTYHSHPLPSLIPESGPRGGVWKSASMTLTPMKQPQGPSWQAGRCCKGR